VLQSGGGLDFLVREVPSSMGDADRAAYLELMASVDQIHYISHAAPARLLLQNGTQDTFWTRAELDKWHESASKPKTVRWYDAEHTLNSEANRDKLEFLVTEISLTSD
jgi:surfactin synthase thioesterase subunit